MREKPKPLPLDDFFKEFERLEKDMIMLGEGLVDKHNVMNLQPFFFREIKKSEKFFILDVMMRLRYYAFGLVRSSEERDRLAKDLSLLSLKLWDPNNPRISHRGRMEDCI